MTWAGRTCRATRETGDSHWSVNSTTVAPRAAALPANVGNVRGVAADVEDEHRVALADVEELIEPVLGVARYAPHARAAAHGDGRQGSRLTNP